MNFKRVLKLLLIEFEKHMTEEIKRHKSVQARQEVVIGKLLNTVINYLGSSINV